MTQCTQRRNHHHAVWADNGIFPSHAFASPRPSPAAPLCGSSGGLERPGRYERAFNCLAAPLSQNSLNFFANNCFFTMFFYDFRPLKLKCARA